MSGWLKRLFGKTEPEDMCMTMFGGKRLAVRPWVKVANAQRPFFKTEHIDDLSRLITRHAHMGRIDEIIAAGGTKLTDDEMKQLGLPPWPKLSHEILAMMTDEGRQAPWQSLRWLVNRTLRWARASFHLQEHARMRAVMPFVIINRPKDVCTCEGVEPLLDRLIPATEVPLLPLLECRLAPCHCSAIGVTKWALKNKHGI